MTTLRGIAPDLPRILDPLTVCADLWRAQTGVTVAWDRQTLESFEAAAPAALAARCDLLVIGHPAIGQACREACLRDLNRPERALTLNRLARQSVGESFTSYRQEGAQWALPIDASVQAMAWRPDRLAAPPMAWLEVEALAQAGHILLPLRPPCALLAFFALCANLGQPCAATGIGELQDATFGASVLTRLRAVTAHLDPACFAMDPVAVLDRLSAGDAAETCAPLVDLSVAYARDGFRPHRLAFGPIPPAGTHGPVGAVLGGAGIAVSAHSTEPELAEAFAFWLASADVQRGPYASRGGQPGNAAGWPDAAGSAVYASLEDAWVRPRHDGYLVFQHAASVRIADGLRQGERAEDIMADLNRMFTASFG